jgi:hypothetical protein
MVNDSGMGQPEPQSTHLKSFYFNGADHQVTERPYISVMHNCGREVVLSFGPVVLLPLPVVPWPLGMYTYYIDDMKDRKLQMEIDLVGLKNELNLDQNEIKLRATGQVLPVGPNTREAGWSKFDIYQSGNQIRAAIQLYL